MSAIEQQHFADSFQTFVEIPYMMACKCSTCVRWVYAFVICANLLSSTDLR